MTIHALVVTKSLESKVDKVVVKVDGLSHTIICLCQWTNKTRWICHHEFAVTFHTKSAKTERISTDDPMQYSVPYHATPLQKMYGPILVIPSIIHLQEAIPVFLSNFTGDVEQENRSGTHQI